MKTLFMILSLFVITACGTPAPAAILVMSSDGLFTKKTTLSAAATDADTVGKTIVVTSALSAVQSNISSASVHSWPANRGLRVEKGGSIANTTAFTFADGASFYGPDGQAFTGSGSVSFPKGSEIKPAWLGIIPDTGADLGAAMTKLNASMAETKGAKVVFPGGVYKSSVLFNPTGYGITVTGIGNVIIEPVDGGSNYILGIGTRGDLQTSSNNALTATMAKGAYTASVTSSTGYDVGDVVFMISGKSVNSSGINRIPLYKQFFTITSITGNDLTFASQAEYDFTVGGDATANPCILASATAKPAVNGKIENITFRNNDTFTGTYLHGVFLAFNFELVNVKLESKSAVGYVASSDNVIYRNVQMSGYSGISTAAGVKKVLFDHVTFNPGVSTDNNGAFLEESPDIVIIQNSDIHGLVSAVSSSDATPPKQVIIRDTRITSTGSAIRGRGIYNAGGYALDIDRCVFDAPGDASVSTPAVKTVVDLAFINTVRITNTDFKNTAADAYALYNSSPSSTVTNLSGNKYGTTGLGIYAGCEDNVTLRHNRGAWTPALKFGGASVDMVTTYAKGNWEKIGNRIFYSGVVKIEAKGSSTGAATITGLPVVSKTDASIGHPVALVVDDITSTVTEFLVGTVGSASTSIGIGKIASGNYAEFTHADCTNTTLIQVGGSYEVNELFYGNLI